MNQWSTMLERWNEWSAPLRPTPEDVSLYKTQLKPNDRVLLLGVTSELLPLATVAIDNDHKAVEIGGPKTIFGDWGALPFQQEFDAIIGDGSLAAFQGKADHFFQQAKKALKPGGRLILRTFIAPEEKETIASVLKERHSMGFHAFKWRVAHTLAAPHVAVQTIYDVIQPVHPHPTINVYNRSPLIYYFPTLSELPSYDHIQYSSSYELADRCPIITWINSH